MARRMKIEPTGEAETKRLQRRGEWEERLQKEEAALSNAQQELKDEEQSTLGREPSGTGKPPRVKEAEDRVDWAQLRVEHVRAAISILDEDNAVTLCEKWDTRQNSNDAYLAALEQMRPEAERIASELVDLMLKGRAAHDAANLEANNASDLVKELADYGIKVREPRPSIVAVQSLIALALREALLTADLSPHAHFTKECLSPGHYTPPEKSKDEEAA